jgi:hypothetical protein
MNTVVAAFAAFTIAFLPLNAIGQNCETISPSCKRAQDRGIALVNSFSQTSGINDSAGAAYCGFLVGSEVMNYCNQELKRIGQNECANLAAQQSAEYRKSAAQALQTMSATSANNVRRKCKWEGGR